MRPRRRREMGLATGSLLAVTMLLFVTAVATAVMRSASPAGDAAAAQGPVAEPTSSTGPTAPSPPPGLSLAERFAAVGYDLPDEVSVYAAQVRTEPDGALDIVEYEAGAGAHDTDFWPASSVKVLVALGALEFLETYGFSGAATVEADTGWTWTVRELVEAAIDESDNYSYDLLVQIAGVDWLNTTFLSAANGFPDTVIQRSYAGFDVRSSPELKISEAGRVVTVPARTSEADYGCPDEGNCTNLYELAQSIERVVLDPELPPRERLGLHPADIDVIEEALLEAEGWIDAGVQEALGANALVYNKPGAAAGYDCVDVGLVDDPVTGNRYVLALTTPLAGSSDCAVLGEVTEEVLEVLAE